MTPEQRAKMKDELLAAGERSDAIPYGPIVRDLHCHPYMELCLDIIAAAIRDAEKAEREACAQIAVTHFDYRNDKSIALAAAIIANRIRERTP